LNAREQQRVMVLNRVERGELTGLEGAPLMGLSLRQVRRLLAACRKEGVSASGGLAHGNRDRSPAHRLSQETRNRVVELARETYPGLNHYHLQEVLGEREGVTLSRSSV
jgi:hypothetical protein